MNFRPYPWICFHNNVCWTIHTFHFELINRCRVIHAHFCFFCIIAYTHSNVILAAFTPDVVRHFKTNNEDSQVKFAGSLPQGMGTLKFVEATLRRVIIRRIILVDSFAFSL